jgi:flagellar biosynthesis/type III secretory pathway M-ring protein FliF/YscJ
VETQSPNDKPPRMRQQFQPWMLIPLVVIVVVVLVAALGAKKIMCSIEGGHYEAGPNTCFVPK